MSEEIRRGRTFWHARFITADRQPELCRITLVLPGQDVVYYRVGVQGGSSGQKSYSGLEYFAKTVFGGWAE